MLVYNLLVTLCFIYVGLVGAWVGVLLWPAVAAHGVMTIALARACFSDRKPLFRERLQ
jgi:hypothetical protein